MQGDSRRARLTVARRVLVALIFVAAVPLAVVSVTASIRFERALRAQTLDQLESVAAIQTERIDAILAESAERVRLVSSRTQLRISLARLLDDAEDAEARDFAHRILEDALSSVPGFVHIWVVDTQGRLLVGTDGIHTVDLEEGSELSATPGAKSEPVLFLDEGEQLAMLTRGAIDLDGVALGTLVIVSDASQLVEAVQDHSGLGATGETVLIDSHDEMGVYLTPLRFDLFAALRRRVEPASVLAHHVHKALGEQLQGHDYRGVEVLAVAHHLESADWMLAAKIDTAEAFAPISQMRRDLAVVAVSVAVLAALASVLLSSSITRPIREVIEGAHRIRVGDLSARVRVSTNDEMAELADAFNLAADSIEGSIDAKDAFLASVAHELRTPLTAVVGLSMELRDHPDLFDRDQTAEFIRLIASQSMEAGHIIEDLLVAARADMENLSVHHQRVRLPDEVDLALAASTQTGSRISVSAEPIEVWADPQRTRQVLRNLISNAARHGGDRVEIIIGSEDGHGIVEIRDDGPGIPEPFTARLFEAFYRGPDARSKPGSTGLGLYISHTLTALMGGTLTHHRRAGWTRFRLSLPLHDPLLMSAGESSAMERMLLEG